MRTTACTAIILAALLSGCASRPDPEDVPGSLPAGDPGRVSAAASSSAGAGEGIRTLSVHPVAAWKQPSIPLVTAPKTASIWVLPRESRDGRSVCEGFWIHTMIDEAHWGLTSTMAERAVPLRQAMDMQANPDGELEMHVVVPDRLRTKARNLKAATTRLPYDLTAPGQSPAPVAPAATQGQ